MSKIRAAAAKTGAFFKKNVYIILIAFAVAVIATMIGLAVGGVFNPAVEEPVVEVPVETPSGDSPVDVPSDDTPVDVPSDDVPVDVPETPVQIVFVSPVVSATSGNGYAETATVFYSFAKEYKPHLGIDFLADSGTAVCAAYGGTVTAVVYDEIFDGNSVTVSHGDGLTTVYASLSSDVCVAVGAKVAAGQKLGTVGTSLAIEAGVGNHVHFETLENGVHVDPLKYLVTETK